MTWMMLEVNTKEKQYRITVTDQIKTHADTALPAKEGAWAYVGSYSKVDDLMQSLTNHLNMEQTKGSQ
jgi:Uri superfamily endonuclease